MLQQYTLLLIYLSVATAKTITGVFNSFNSLTWSNAATYNYRDQEPQLGMLFWVGL